MFSIVTLAIGTVALHRIPDFADRGFNTKLIANATAMGTVFAGVATFVFGRPVKYLNVRILGALGFSLLAIASVMTIYATNNFIMFSSMSVFGCGIGGMMILQNFIWADYFGREHLGEIQGFAMMFNLILGGIGAPLAGYVHDWTQTYGIVWWAAVALMVCSARLFLATPAPTKTAESESAAELEV